MFLDEIDLTFKAGTGGNGLVSFFPGRKSGPDGGSGGAGGNLFVQADHHITNLNQFVGKTTIFAENGKNGEKRNKTGAKGKDLILNLPVGTVLIDTQNQEELELNSGGDKFLVCKGGFGGRGNFEFKSASNTTPKEAEKGLPGEQRKFKIMVRLIADIGLIGLPNAGKSSLLNELTNAQAKVADYPFTTIQPNLGVCEGKIIADIPGLIEGASEGKGLGYKFLKHIEKVKMLIHCINSQSEDVVRDYKLILDELEKYNSELLNKKQIILLTKSDLVSKEELKLKLKSFIKYQSTVLPVSIYDWESLGKLKGILSLGLQ